MNKQELIDKLNEDLAGEFSAILQYITYAAKATICSNKCNSNENMLSSICEYRQSNTSKK